ncbi:putative secreted protein associated with spyDAC [Pediococcus damnosus]|uniref:CdaR family protein n=1 Tax=Pediococcus damnosus TaxID=51663 RepID=UPI00078C5AE6|nr:CdaR family protein [Pediococcus damnosus]AMV59995.1 putative secreted protein associated with spyDAC [Pediococcus damnosus]AMV64239.1 putative secreted protein associated with spyDAC [Pediococcus damnosus]
MRNFWKQRWVYRILALILAVLLFTYVKSDEINSNNAGSNGNSGDATLMANKSKTLTVPLELDVNSSKYLISGYPSKVKIKITGPSALVTTTTNTQNFKAYVSLRKLGVGKHRVQIKEEGLNKELAYSFEPQSINVTVANRKTKTFAIQPEVNQDVIAKGYEAKAAILRSQTVTATGSVSEINRITEVVARINLPNNTKKNSTTQVLLQALDNKGDTVNVILDPQAVSVTVPVDPKSSNSTDSSSKSTKGSSSEPADNKRTGSTSETGSTSSASSSSSSKSASSSSN